MVIQMYTVKVYVYTVLDEWIPLIAASIYRRNRESKNAKQSTNDMRSVCLSECLHCQGDEMKRFAKSHDCLRSLSLYLNQLSR